VKFNRIFKLIRSRYRINPSFRFEEDFSANIIEDCDCCALVFLFTSLDDLDTGLIGETTPDDRNIETFRLLLSLGGKSMNERWDATPGTLLPKLLI
jgi:hypothetical protein